jgi:hypothetical protein
MNFKHPLIDLMMEAVQTSETFANSYQSTRHYNPEDGHLHTHRRENLKSYTIIQHPDCHVPLKAIIYFCR